VPVLLLPSFTELPRIDLLGSSLAGSRIPRSDRSTISRDDNLGIGPVPCMLLPMWMDMRVSG
jgi:hypothetical protein